MNRLGIIVDLSHTAASTMRDVLGGTNEKDWSGSLAPVVFNHSSAYAICPHPRNVPDDVLHLVKARNSLVMVTFFPDFVSCCNLEGGNKNGIPERYNANLTISQVVKHMRYIGDLIGYDHVGIGSDFDGMPAPPRGLEDVTKYPDLVAEMLRQGISDADARLVVGKNLLRVWGDVDRVAREMQEDGVMPAEDDLPPAKKPW